MRGFKFAEFDALCADLSDEELQLKWQHYTRALTSASTSTSVAVLAAGPTGGVSIIGAMIAGPLLHNARRKRQMVGRHMRSRGLEPETRRKDVLVPMAIGGAVGAATMGVGSIGAEALAVDAVVDKTVAKVVLHTALDVGATAGEERHLKHELKKERRRLAAGGAGLRPSKSFVAGETEVDPEVRLAGQRLRPSRSFVLDDGQLLFQPPRTQQQLVVPPLRQRRSSTSDTVLDPEYTMAGALASSSSVADEDDQVNQVPEKQRYQPYRPDAMTTSPKIFVERYPLISEYITSSDVLGEASAAHSGVDATMLAGLFESFDEETLAELERDLEQAIEDMDSATVVDDQAAEHAHDAESAETEHAGRTFEEPADTDRLIKRHSVMYTSKVKRRSEIPSMYMGEAPPAYSVASSSQQYEPTDSKTEGGPREKDTYSLSRLERTSTMASASSVQTMPPTYEDSLYSATMSSTSAASSSYHQSTSASVSSYQTHPGYARSTSEYSSLSSADSWTSNVTSSTYKGKRPVSRDDASSIYSESDVSTVAPSESGFSTVSRTSTLASRASSVASSTHQGLAKTNYLGLETATKLAIGGSLCLVGVRPSVQRKMLDKAKGKISDAREARRAEKY